ncbi:MAG TPA: alkaline phosphatase PhoX [Iamia sp.]|nr:alkaline phosphatase PhoX [Iamia sp.]
MTPGDLDIDRRRMLRLMGLGLVSTAVLPWVAGCSDDDGESSGGGTTTGPETTASTTTTTTTAPPAPVRLGPLGEPDDNGVRLPEGFTSRILATTGEVVAGTEYAWHVSPDGGAVFPQDDGGWVYTSNCEDPVAGGAGMIRFDADGEIVAAGRICEGTYINCAGGATPWGTWLTCEEIGNGQVWECDVLGGVPAVVKPALGVFKHEAVTVDPEAQVLYLSEDEPDGALYRFTPAAWPSLDEGELAVLAGAEGSRRWEPLPDPAGVNGAAATPTRNQVADVVRFNGGEGLAHFEGTTYLSTKGDGRIWALDGQDVEVVYDTATTEVTDEAGALLTGVDNITVDVAGDRYVAEDGGTMDIIRLGPDGIIEQVCQVTGVEGSEITGPAFSPDGTRLYFSSQRGPGRTYEVSGPFPHAEA